MGREMWDDWDKETWVGFEWSVCVILVVVMGDSGDWGIFLPIAEVLDMIEPNF